MLKYLIFLLWLGVSNWNFGQPLMTVQFEFPQNGIFKIRIDSNAVYSTKKIQLAEGNYFVEIWVPGTEVRMDTIVVKSDTYNLFQYRSAKVLPEISKNKSDRIEYGIKASLAFSTFIPTGIAAYYAIQKYNSGLSLYHDLEVLSKSLDLNYLSEVEGQYGMISNFEKYGVTTKCKVL
ncbi:hypothetical protein DNU06_01240 [Putridiphycobacter roseus]|uniref:Uncharacterized protein n=1 Tax=Putridiphycobacter roseus TaxID=2219161 RepID=A0A2W1NKV2_9FLAO|nr:hypothetical protein [Putridiphycobacter roseus]PZE18486.1 hypothetical protein DNU06_01240 [Putridiphycobacter roseus]